MRRNTSVQITRHARARFHKRRLCRFRNRNHLNWNIGLVDNQSTQPFFLGTEKATVLDTCFLKHEIACRETSARAFATDLSVVPPWAASLAKQLYIAPAPAD